MGNPYNGFTSDERDEAYYWLMAEKKAGRRTPPKVCDCCGQTEGWVSWHSEDYSAPYGDHVGGVGVCYTCHTLVHCRFKSPVVWKEYVAAVVAGKRAAPLKYNAWGTVKGYLWGGKPIPYSQHEPRPGGLLDRIDAGEFLDRGGENSSEKRHAMAQEKPRCVRPARERQASCSSPQAMLPGLE